MKKAIIYVAAMLIPTLVFGQAIKIDQYGNVNLSNNNFKFTGQSLRFQKIYMEPNDSYEGFYIGEYDMEPALHPDSRNFGYLGTSNKYWYRLYVNNAYFRSHANTLSDEREKQNIRTLDYTNLDKLKQLNPVKYNLKPIDDKIGLKSANPELIDQLKAKREQELKKETYGFLAQELMEIYPEVVNYNKESDQYAIKYTALIPILVSAIQEQQDQIEKQHEKIEVLTKNLELNNQNLVYENQVASLKQNSPNPFTESTEIAYFLPETNHNAFIYIYDMNGVLLKQYPLEQQGNGSITIESNEFGAGMYLYALVADNKEIDVKRMILTN